MSDELDIILNFMVEVIDVVTISIIFYGFCYAFFLTIKHHVHRLSGRLVPAVSLHRIRVELGEYLLLALELFICADVILSVQNPSYEHLLQLGIVVIIRIIISFFLQREIGNLEGREG